MPSTWVAVDAGIDPLSWARLLRRAYDRAVTDGVRDDPSTSTIVRPVISASWMRSQQAGVDAESRPPIMLESDELARRLEQPGLHSLLPIIRNVLARVAEYAQQAVILADAQGHLLWVGGDPKTRTGAKRINLVPGALWSEEASGTNGVGTAIALDHPVQVFSAEHFKQRLHNWSCAAAPIHDPESDELLAVVALAGSFRRAHPHGFSLVVAASQIAEAQLQHVASQRDEQLKVKYLEHVLGGCDVPSAVVNPHGRILLSMPPGWLGSRLRLSVDGVPVSPVSDEVRVDRLHSSDGFLVLRECEGDSGDHRPQLRIEALGRERAAGSLGRRSFEFTPRHSEILVILAQHPDGLSEDDLVAALYGSSIKNVTIRAEISRLRRLLGSVILTRPYRLVADVRADFLELLSLLEQEAGPAAAKRYPGKLLPSSVAPAVVETRHRIEAAVRRSRTRTSSQKPVGSGPEGRAVAGMTAPVAGAAG
jgi:hypothetical protein